MFVSRNVIAVCLLAGLAICAISAGSASAAGTTAYECRNSGAFTGPSKFSDAHCKSADASGSFGHVTIPLNTSTAISVSNVTTGGERSAFFFKYTEAGFSVSLEATTVSATGTLENKELGPEMYAEGSFSTVVFEGVTANQMCTVTGIPGGAGKIETTELKATTQGQGDAVKVEPKTGDKLAEFQLGGNSCPAPLKAKPIPVFGTVKGIPNGATVSFSHAEITTAKTLRVTSTEGPPAGIEGSITVSASGNPIAATT